MCICQYLLIIIILNLYTEEKDEYDATGQRNYIRACESIGIIPASHFIRCLLSQEATIDLSHHYIGPKGAKAVAVALVVSIDPPSLSLSPTSCPLYPFFLSSLHLFSPSSFFLAFLHLSSCSFSLSFLCAINHLSLSFLPSLSLLRPFLSPSLSSLPSSLPSSLTPSSVSPQSNTTVTNLNLSYNGLCSEGGVAILDMLKENCYITHLDLSNNAIGAAGAVMLYDILHCNTTVVHCNLSGK